MRLILAKTGVGGSSVAKTAGIPEVSVVTMAGRALEVPGSSGGPKLRGQRAAAVQPRMAVQS